MRIVKDQMGRTVSIGSTQRIISLVPSQTELLYDLGLEKEVAGITKFCVHPEQWFHKKTRVGGTKQLKFEIIDEIEPDLIIANKEENNKSDIEKLSEKYPVWVSNINRLPDALEMIHEIGVITGNVEKARIINDQITRNFQKLPGMTKLKAAYFIWKEPYMVAGGDCFINEMMSIAGFQNVFGDRIRYPEVTIDEIRKAKPQLLLLSSEPFPFKKKHGEELKTIFPETDYILVDGEMFSWYGSRLIFAADYFQQLRHEILTKFGYAASDR